MPDIFISYSRRDKEFAQKFANEWTSNGRDAWVDWEDIPVTADWLAEIHKGIRESDAFVFIISPDSVTSEVCGWEIDYAIQNQKRFIPILYREVVEPEHKEKMHSAISSHNWLFFRDEDDFDASFITLRDAVDTDLDHVREHTRLLVRAQEWETKEKSNSYLLQGDDLANAESWLASAQSKTPHPTQLHSDYIYASRKAANRRQQILLSSALVATVISLALAVAAIIGFITAEENRQEAVEQREIADRNAEVSNSLAIAANAQLEFSLSDIDLAIALARQAVNLQDPPVEAVRILEDTVFAPGTRYILEGHSDTVQAVDFNPDETLLASGSNDGLVIIWDVETGEEVHRIDLTAADEDRHRVRAVAFSPDGTMLTASDRDGQAIVVWNTEDYSEIQRIDELGDWATRLEFSPDSTQILAGFDDETSAVILYDVASGEQIISFGNDDVRHSDTIDGIDFSPDGTLVASGSRDDRLIIWDIETGEPLTIIEAETDVTGIDFSADGQFILGGGGPDVNFSLRVWSVETGLLVEDPLTGHVEFPNDAEFDSTGRFIISGSGDTTVRVWSLQTNRELYTLTGHVGSVRDVTFSRDGLLAASASADETIRIWDLAHGAQLQQFNGHLATNVVSVVGFVPNSTHMFSGGWDANLVLWDTESGEELFRFPDHERWVLDSDINATGTRLIVGHEGGAVVYELESNEEIMRFTEHNASVRRVAISPDGTIAITGGNDNQLMMWNVDTGELLIDPIVTGNTPDSVSFNADGTRFIFSTTANTIVIRAVDNPSEDLYVFEDLGDFAKFTVNEAQILVVDSNRVMLIDLETGTEVIGFDGHNSEVFAIDLNSDESQLATGSSDGTIRLWDVASGSELRRISVGTEVYSVAFSADDVTLASGDFAVRLWDIEPPSVEDVLSWADANRYNRALTPDECGQFHVTSCTPDAEPTTAEGEGES